MDRFFAYIYDDCRNLLVSFEDNSFKNVYNAVLAEIKADAAYGDTYGYWSVNFRKGNGTFAEKLDINIHARRIDRTNWTDIFVYKNGKYTHLTSVSASFLM